MSSSRWKSVTKWRPFRSRKGDERPVPPSKVPQPGAVNDAAAHEHLIQPEKSPDSGATGAGDSVSGTAENSNVLRQPSTTTATGKIPMHIEQLDADEDLAARHKDREQSLYASNLYPRQVDCRLVLFLDRKGPYTGFEEFKILWQKQYNERFGEIDRGVKRWLSEKFGVSQANLYRFAGTCVLLRLTPAENGYEESMIDSEILEKEKDWSTVLQTMVGKFYSKNQNKRCKIELRWEYKSLVIRQIPGKTFAQAVRSVVRDKMEQNWLAQDYLPRADFNHIFSDEMVSILLKEDWSLKSSSQYRMQLNTETDGFSLEDFTREVCDTSVRLLAVCVYSEMPLACLHRLMRSGIKGSNLPLERKHFETLKELKGVDDFKCDNFRKTQGSFIPHTFEPLKGGPPVHQSISASVVIPIKFDPKKDKLGTGGYGEVFKAKICTGHHRFTANRDEVFALKRWKTWDEYAEEAFKDEETPLQRLHSAKCGNVVLHLASWSQEHVGQGLRFYMLFPKAECNLREYLKLYPAPAQDAAHVSWLFKQLFDLTDAVDQIHIMSPQEPEGPDSDNLRTTPPRKSGGFHHDLKPDNILAFKDPETGLFVLRITDFGVARLDFAIASKSRNQDSQTRSNRGDPVYGAPDYSVQNHLGRKADIWSLGCCFLEVLMWNFGFGGEKLEDFRLARYREPTSSMGVIAAFWYFNEDDNTVALKPAVTEMLEKLQRICSGKGQFRILVQWIEFMLTLKQKERPKASEVRSAFKAMHQEVEANLHNDKKFYMKVLPTGGSKTTTTFAPVTEIYATSSRDDSIDGRKVPAPYGVAHPATPAAAGKHQRSSSGPSLKAPQSHVRTSSTETTQSGGQFLSPSVDDVYTNGRPRAPSIEISEPTVGLGSRAQSILSGLYESPTRDEIPTLRRKGSGSSKSQTL